MDLRSLTAEQQRPLDARDSLGDTGVNDEHAAHGSAGIVKHPFSGVFEIRCKVSLGVILD